MPLSVVEQAEKEVEEALFREKVEREKERIYTERAKKTLWERLFPWEITVTRR